MKTALVTGGSRGIGKATVSAFLKSGYKVITTSTTGKSPFNNTYKLNLSDPSSIQEFTDFLNKDNSQIDVLINNAAMVVESENMVGADSLRKTLEVNLIGTIDLTQKLLPRVNNNGVIINISSRIASLCRDHSYDYPSYRISKTAINMYTVCLSEHPEIKSKSIKVYSFDPGWVKTDMGGPNAEREPEEPAKEIVELVVSEKESGLFYKGLKVREW